MITGSDIYRQKMKTLYTTSWKNTNVVAFDFAGQLQVKSLAQLVVELKTKSSLTMLHGDFEKKKKKKLL